MGYFRNVNRWVYYFRIGKNGMNIYNFDDPTEFGDEVVETHMIDDQPIDTSHDVPEGDAFMHDAAHGDAHGNSFGFGFGDPSSSWLCYKTCSLSKMNIMRKIVGGELPLSLLKWRAFV